MIKYHFALATDKTCNDLLDDLEAAGVVDFKEFTWTNPKDGAEYSVVAYTEDGLIPQDFDEGKAKTDFFKDIHKQFKVGV